jgi:hypothetical protein
VQQEDTNLQSHAAATAGAAQGVPTGQPAPAPPAPRKDRLTGSDLLRILEAQPFEPPDPEPVTDEEGSPCEGPPSTWNVGESSAGESTSGSSSEAEGASLHGRWVAVHYPHANKTPSRHRQRGSGPGPRRQQQQQQKGMGQLVREHQDTLLQGPRVAAGVAPQSLPTFSPNLTKKQVKVGHWPDGSARL